MNISFSKYQGTGNDFILIDDRHRSLSLNQDQVAALCDRHFGIGADGLILLVLEDGYDFRMVYYNSDGRESSMCGNGGRCITAFAKSLGLFETQTRFLAVDGPHEATVENDGNVRLKMIDTGVAEMKAGNVFFHTGSPHLVVPVGSLESYPVVETGRYYQPNPDFAGAGCNINFIEPLDGDIAVRTYERGVEDETLSCGTGVTASALFAHNQGWNESGPVRVVTPGGELLVHFEVFEEGYRNIWLEGPATHVFDGVVYLP